MLNTLEVAAQIPFSYANRTFQYTYNRGYTILLKARASTSAATDFQPILNYFAISIELDRSNLIRARNIIK